MAIECIALRLALPRVFQGLQEFVELFLEQFAFGNQFGLLAELLHLLLERLPFRLFLLQFLAERKQTCAQSIERAVGLRQLCELDGSDRVGQFVRPQTVAPALFGLLQLFLRLLLLQLQRLGLFLSDPLLVGQGLQFQQSVQGLLGLLQARQQRFVGGRQLSVEFLQIVFRRLALFLQRLQFLPTHRQVAAGRELAQVLHHHAGHRDRAAQQGHHAAAVLRDAKPGAE